MALNCGWELLLTHNSGTQKSTCGLTNKECVCTGCAKRIKAKKAYDVPVASDSRYQIQAGDRIWPKIKNSV
jgi:hypothetical protein